MRRLPEPPRARARPRTRPTVRELPADLLTPVAAYLRVRDLGPGFLLESIERGQQVGRYSFLAAGCETIFLDAAPERPSVFEHNPYNPVTARIFARAPIDRGCHMIKPHTLRDTFQAASLEHLDSGYLLFVPEPLNPAARFRRTGAGVVAVWAASTSWRAASRAHHHDD